MLGEDLAWGTGSDAQPEAIVQAWMDSPPHRRIMLDCRFSQLGVGIAAGRFGDDGERDRVRRRLRGVTPLRSAAADDRAGVLARTLIVSDVVPVDAPEALSTSS